MSRPDSPPEPERAEADFGTGPIGGCTGDGAITRPRHLPRRAIICACDAGSTDIEYDPARRGHECGNCGAFWDDPTSLLEHARETLAVFEHSPDFVHPKVAALARFVVAAAEALPFLDEITDGHAEPFRLHNAKRMTDRLVAVLAEVQ